MRAAIFLSIIVLSGCLGSSTVVEEQPLEAGFSEPDEHSAQAGFSELGAPPGEVAPRESVPDPSVHARPGSLRITGLVPLEAGSVLLGDASMGFRADENGEAEILFLEPGTMYSVQVGGHEFDVRTPELAWNWTSERPALIQPGWTEPMNPKHCTLGVILRDGHFEKLYGVMVGHCANQVGEIVGLPPSYGGQDIGQVVSRTYNDDWGRGRALVFEIDPQWYGDVNPSIYEIGGPTAIGNVDEMEIGDRLCFYGHGYDGEGGPVQEDLRARCGEYTGTEHLVHPGYSTFAMKIRADRGDSGSAIVDEAGRWQGIAISGIQHESTMATPACRVLEDAAADGYHLGLVTAPYDGFQPAPYNHGSTGVWATYGYGPNGAKLCRTTA